jgi:hypothetical protein
MQQKKTRIWKHNEGSERRRKEVNAQQRASSRGEEDGNRMPASRSQPRYSPPRARG